MLFLSAGARGAESIVRTVPAGWSLFSLPCEPAGAAAPEFFDDRFDFSLFFAGGKYDWTSHLSGFSTSTAYWIYKETAEDINFDCAMREYGPDVFALAAGWNLVGTPANVTLYPGRLLADGVPFLQSPKVIPALWTWDGSRYASSSGMIPYEGYFIKARENCVVTASAATAVYVGGAVARPGAGVSVPVHLFNAAGVAGVTLVIFYDREVLTAKDSVYGGLIEGIFVENITIPGQIRIAVAGASGYTGTGVLVTLNFTVGAAAAPGVSQLNLSAAEINDENGFPVLNFESYSGMVKIGK